jgi:cytochrome c oxidase subunit II
MNIVIGILSLAFIVASILLIRKTSAISKAVNGKTEDTEYSALSSYNDIQGFGLFAVFIIGVIGGVWSFIDSMPQMFRTPNSIHGKQTDDMFWFSMSIVTVAFVITSGVLFYFAFRYRYSKNRVAKFYPENHKLELIWTVVPAIVMAGLVIGGWKAWSKIMGPAPKDAIEIEIIGKQFGWVARYSGVSDNKLGNYDFRKIDNTNEVGIDFTDANAFDDFVLPELHIPKGVPVLLKIRSKDVLHSVFLPDMRVKMDAVPGMPTKFWFTADKTTDEKRAEMNNQEYNYKLNCTEVCGNGHFGMAINMYVHEKEDYDKWYKEQKPFLTMFPEYLEKVPANLKSKAAKFATPAVEETTETVAVTN